MKGHMWHHVHVNALMFCIPYLVVLYVFMGKAISVVSLQAWDFARSRTLPTFFADGKVDSIESSAPVTSGTRKEKGHVPRKERKMPPA